MAMMNKIDDEMLEKVSGGESRTVQNNGTVNYANIRIQPGLDSEILFTIDNGCQVETTGNTIKRDGYTWYEVALSGAYSYGWVAGHLIGY